MTGSIATTARVALLGLAATLLAGPASAGLLERPPRLTTFKLDDPAAPALPLLDAFHNAAIERPGPMRLYLNGHYGRWSQRPWWNLTWVLRTDPDSTPGDPLDAAGETALALDDASLAVSDQGSPFSPSPAEPLSELSLAPVVPTGFERVHLSWTRPVFASTGASLRSNGFDVLWEPLKKPVRDWRCRRRPVQFERYSGERAAFALVLCDGSVAPGALDRLSIMARPPDAPNPGDLLPDEPDADAWRALEWVPQVRVMNTRLLWLLQRVADAFPWRPIHIFSGYRPKPPDGSTRGGHHSLHSEGRAMDILVIGIPNAALFQFCRTLEDVGCGFYPNSKFVHVDVRRPGTGRALWIDASGPGEPSRYVDTWPGVVERGAMPWSARGSEGNTPPAP